MALNRALFTKQLNLGLNTVFGMEYDRYPEQWREIYSTEQSQKAFEEDVQMIGFGAAPTKAEGAAISYESGREGFVSRYVHETIALAFSITEEAEEDGLYGSLGAKYARALARSMQHTKEIKGANILNNATSSSQLGGDGQPLLSASHPLGGGGTASNKLGTAADLSETSLETLLIQIAQAEDDRGIPIALTGQKLIVPHNLVFIAERVLKSNLRPGTADNDINAMRNMGMIPGGVVVNQRLTDTDQYFIMTDCPDGMKHFVRAPIKKAVEGDFETGNLRYKVRERYSFGFTDWRAIFGSEGAA